MVDGCLGEIRMFAGTYAPEGWALCDGRSLSVNEFQALYALIGNIWGGDQIAFKIPDLRGRVPIGTGQGPGLTKRVIGGSGGAAEVMAEVPTHRHKFYASTLPATSLDPKDKMLATVTPDNNTKGLYLKPPANPTISPMAADSVVEEPGGAELHDNIMPSMGLNFILCLYGEFPVQG
ncbi:MAG: tail fiber protein [Pseudomonadota bacterium]